MAVDGEKSSFPDPDQKFGLHDLFINVLGASFSITADKDPKYLSAVLEQYELAIANTQSISGMKDPLKVAILTGFLLCDEINELKQQAEEEQAAAERALDRARELINHLDKVIERSHLGDG